MTQVASSAGAGSGVVTCMFPGCTRPVRERAGEGGGKPPIYCDLLNPATRKLAHTPLTAARERARRERQATRGQSVGPLGDAPASAARERAAGLLDQFRSAAEQLTGTLVTAIEAMTSAGDPESVSAELAAAHRQVERTRLEAEERIHAAETAREQATAETAAARQAAREAAAARDEAITELDTLDATLATTRADLEHAHTEHAGELQRIRTEADRALTAIRTETAEQLSAAEQRASEATSRAEEAREELRQSRREHRDELTALRREHRDELSAERQRADSALETLRAEHRRDIQTLQTALTALRTTQHEQPIPPPHHTADTPPTPAQPAELGQKRLRHGSSAAHRA